MSVPAVHLPPTEPSSRPLGRPWLVTWLVGLVLLPVLYLYVDPFTTDIRLALRGDAALSWLMDALKPLGKLGPQAALLGLCFLVAYFRSRRAAGRWLWLTVLCLMATGVAVHTTKLVVGRTRPKNVEVTAPEPSLRERITSNKFKSFPSADVASIAAIAVAAMVFVPRAGLPLLMLGVLVGFSRIASNMHHPADVWGGMLTGTAVSAGVVHWWRRRAARAPDDAACVCVAPQQTGEGGSEDV